MTIVGFNETECRESQRHWGSLTQDELYEQVAGGDFSIPLRTLEEGLFVIDGLMKTLGDKLQQVNIRISDNPHTAGQFMAQVELRSNDQNTR